MRKKILVVEDEPKIREGILDALSFQGFEVMAAERGDGVCPPPQPIDISRTLKTAALRMTNSQAQQCARRRQSQSDEWHF